MKRKKIFLLFFFFLLCGCSAEVDLKIEENEIQEAITINAYQDQMMSKTMIYNSFRKYIPAFYYVEVPDLQEDNKIKGVNYYEREVKDLGNGYSFQYRYNYPFQSYEKARSVKNSFKSSFISKDEKGIITISTDSMGSILIRQYDNLAMIKVNMHTDGYEVLETNGTLENGVYSWVFSQEDNHKSIYMKLKKIKVDQEDVMSSIPNSSSKKKEENDFFSKHPIILILGGLSLFFILLLFLIRKKTNKYE